MGSMLAANLYTPKIMLVGVVDLRYLSPSAAIKDHRLRNPEEAFRFQWPTRTPQRDGETRI
jgi:hypothetical protein